MLAIDDEQYDELPKPLRELYLKYDSAREEALEYHYSPFLCQEDKQDAADKMNLFLGCLAVELYFLSSFSFVEHINGIVDIPFDDVHQTGVFSEFP